jgi:hypothetical protein
MATVLSGISGAFYYKPAGTLATFSEADVNATNNTIYVGTFMGFRVGDPVKFDIINSTTGATGTGTLPATLSSSTTYYVLTYSQTTGLMTVSTSAGGTVEDISDDGTASSPNKFRVQYGDFGAVSEVRDWSIEISRAEIDVTTIGQSMTEYVPFRSYISGFGDANGSATVYMTDEDNSFANRIIQDVLRRKQVGARMKLYIDRVESAGVVDDTKSRSIETEVTLTSASFSVNPDDAQSIAINFRPSSAVSLDLTTSA